VIGCAFGVFVPGVWQPLAGPTGAPLCDPTAWVRDAPPFLVNSASQFRTAGPYALDSAAYAADYNEVKQLGSLTSTIRTPLQTHLAVFYQSNPGVNYNLLAQRFVAEKSLDTTDSARLFAMIDLNAAMRSSPPGAISTPGSFGGHWRRSSTAQTTATPRRWEIRPGHRCSARRSRPRSPESALR
jgi:hypothetical protein